MSKKKGGKVKDNIPGSYRFRPDGNSVQLTVTIGKRFDGKPNRFYKDVPYTTDAQLNIDRMLFYTECLQKDRSVSTSLTVAGLFDLFITDYCINNRQSTVSRYRTLYANQISDHLGNRKVTTLKPIEVQQWVNYIKAHGRKLKPSQRAAGQSDTLSAKTVHHAFSLLRTMLDFARTSLAIIDKNPCYDCKLPKVQKKKIEYYTEEEVVELLDLLYQNIDDNRTHVTMVFLFLFTGIRTGEMAGLRWSEVDLEHNLVKISRTRMYLYGSGVVEDVPKTDSSIREISIPKFVSDLLRQLQQWQLRNKMLIGPDYIESEEVAVTVYGEPEFPRNTYGWFTRFQKKHGLKHMTIHALRHTHVALLTRLGAQPIDISKRVGHSNVRVTQEIYTYLFKDVDSELSDKLDDFARKAAQ